VAEPLKNVPADYEARLVKMDFATTAKNRERSWPNEQALRREIRTEEVR